MTGLPRDDNSSAIIEADDSVGSINFDHKGLSKNKSQPRIPLNNQQKPALKNKQSQESVDTSSPNNRFVQYA